MRRLTIVMALLGLIAGACSSGLSGHQSYSLNVDAASPAGKKFQVSAFFPGRITVNPGDTIKFTNRSTEAPHTITFGVLADRSNQPQLVLPTGENPVAFGKCYSEDNPTPQLTKCPHAQLPAYNGAGYWNSGVLQPAPAPAAAGAKTVTVELSDDIPAGQYAFVCVLHPLMNGVLAVTEEEQDRKSPEDVLTEARDDAAGALADAQKIEEPKLETSGNTVTAAAGWGDRVTSVNRFAPDPIEVKTGTTVQWVARSPYEPHTVTFDSPYKEPADPKSFMPGGVKSGSGYTGGFANSGLLGPQGGPFPSGPFALRFDKAGTYTYVCTLHPGQQGVVKVT
jgi:plastocyanin